MADNDSRIGAGVPDGRPFRLGFLLHLDSDLSPAAALREAIELFVVAEHLGFDSGWVIHRHFRQGNEHVSAPLVLLAAIAQHTSQIELGTGVFVLPLADPIAVAEDAVTLDLLSAGRLQLGVGSGPFAAAWEAFGRDIATRHQLFDDSVDQLHALLSGQPVNSAGEVLHPPGADLRGRLWQAITGDPTRAHAAARRTAAAGDGLQLSRAHAWRGSSVAQSQHEQARWIESYRGAFGESTSTPRVQVSRAIYPHPDPDAALELVTPGVRRWQSWTSTPQTRRPQSVADYLRADNALLGPGSDIAASLAQDPALHAITDLLISFVPGVPDRAEHIRLLTETATEVAPALGWAPAGASPPLESRTYA